ncbi:MAG: hypothetical protein IJ809_00875 [Clostridia bacterium]|nr:hypothetical protein [Clostridia bacterium]
MDYIGLKHRPTLFYEYLKPLLKENKIKMTIPNQPKNTNQRYVTNLNDKNNL